MGLTMKNKHGLPRYVPPDVRLALRQEAGFGCVKCGAAFCEYEHIDPTFPEAKSHDPAKMAFLCPACHTEVTSGRASKDSVWAAKADPFCRRSGHAWGPLEFGGLTCTFGDMFFLNCRVVLRVSNEDLLTVAPPEAPGGPFRVNAKLYDGDLAFQIEDNAIILNKENWDVEVRGTSLTIRRGERDIFLAYMFTPKAGVRLERLDMLHHGVRVSVNDQRVVIGDAEWGVEAVSAMFGNCETCIVATPTSIRFGDELTLSALANPYRGNYRFIESRVGVGGIWLASGSLELLNCWFDRGILVDRGAKLKVVAGVINGTLPPPTA